MVDAAPSARGIIPGMPLAEALSRCSGAVLVDADLPRYQAAFNSLLDSLEGVSPLVEGDGLGLAYVGLDGLEDLYGGEDPLLDSLARAVAPYEAGAGVGEAKFTAYLAAQAGGPYGVVANAPVPKDIGTDAPCLLKNRIGGPFRARRPSRPRTPAMERAVYPAGERLFQLLSVQRVPHDVQAFLRDFSVDVLPLPWETIERLRSFGLKTLGEVARLPPGPLQAQLGPEGLLAWELSRGIDRRPLLPRRSEETVTESLTFPAPAVSIGPILLAAETLLAQAFRRPQVSGRYVRAVVLEARVYRGTAFVQRVAFKEPAGNALQAYHMVKPRLLNIQLPGPLDDLSATLLGLTGESGRQSSFFSEVRKRDSLREALRQLEVRLGQRPPVYRVREVEPWSRIPERRRALVEYVP